MPGPFPLERLSVSIDRTGAHGPIFEDILQSLRAAYMAIYGSDLNLADDTQDGQWLAVQSKGFYDANLSIIAAYLSYSPSFAQGIGLSSVVKINGLRRQESSYSSVEVTIIGEPYTEIRNGRVNDMYGNQWILPDRLIIPRSGEITALATAQYEGDYRAAVGTVTVIGTPQPGWQSVYNHADAMPGLPVETDAQLRQRQAISTSLPAITPLLAVWAAVANIRGVGRTKCYENDTHLYNDLGLPPHSLAVVVYGGDTYEIALTIHRKKNTGCGTFGTTEVIVYEPPSAPAAINFMRLKLIQIYVHVIIRPLPQFISGTAGLIRMAVNEHIITRDIGEWVHAAWLCPPASLTGEAAVDGTGRTQADLDRLRTTYILEAIYLGTDPAHIDQHEIVIPFDAAATCDIGNITVTIADN
jgi:hypothetical protein